MEGYISLAGACKNAFDLPNSRAALEALNENACTAACSAEPACVSASWHPFGTSTCTAASAAGRPQSKVRV